MNPIISDEKQTIPFFVQSVYASHRSIPALMPHRHECSPATFQKSTKCVNPHDKGGVKKKKKLKSGAAGAAIKRLCC